MTIEDKIFMYKEQLKKLQEELAVLQSQCNHQFVNNGLMRIQCTICGFEDFDQ